jgi:hypothetical protein
LVRRQHRVGHHGRVRADRDRVHRAGPSARDSRPVHPRRRACRRGESSRGVSGR